MSFKSGFIALIGLPNTGKSTLLNNIFDKKIAIVSNKAQTTRNAIRGILNHKDYQLIFIDTPGIHDPQDEFGRYLNRESFSNIEGADCVYFLIDATKPFRQKQFDLLERIHSTYPDLPIIGVVNKIDLINKSELIVVLESLNEKFNFNELIPVSALVNDNVGHLMTTTLNYISEGPRYFSEEDEVDYTKSFLISEIIREKVLYLTKEEIPHQIGVVIEKIEEDASEMLIYATIIVSSASQKPILLGKQGSMIKKIKQLSQRELKKNFNKTVHLDIYVSVEPNWRNKLKTIKNLGYSDE